MSEPTYLIRVEHDPTSLTLPYDAKVTRITDGSHVITRWGSSVEEAVKSAQEYLRLLAGEREPTQEFAAHEDGSLIVGESVRVLP